MPMIDARRWQHYHRHGIDRGWDDGDCAAPSGRTGLERGAETMAQLDAIYGKPSNPDPMYRSRAGGGWNHVG